MLHQILRLLRRDAQQALRIRTDQRGQGNPQPVVWNNARYVRVSLDLQDRRRVQRACGGHHPAEFGQIADVDAQGGGV